MQLLARVFVPCCFIKHRRTGQLVKCSRLNIKLVFLPCNVVAFVIDSGYFSKKLFHTRASRFGVAWSCRCVRLVHKVSKGKPDARTTDRCKAFFIRNLAGVVLPSWRDGCIENLLCWELFQRWHFQSGHVLLYISQLYLVPGLPLQLWLSQSFQRERCWFFVELSRYVISFDFKHLGSQTLSSLSFLDNCVV